MESASVETGPGQTLNDLQNYLVHFNKEIETADQPGAESQSGSESASISVDVVAAKTEPGSQFTTGFYSEQQVIPTSLGASVQELSVMTPTAAAVETQNAAGNSDVNSESDQIENESKHQDESADSLENYHDYIASLTGEKIDGEELTVEPVTMAQELAVNSMMDGLVAHTSAGKMIRIVSVGKDGQMQLIGEDMPAGISISNLQLKQEPPSELDNISSTIDSKHSGVIDGTDPVAVLASVATNTSNVNNLQNRNELNDAQLVALQNSADSSQPQLVAVQSGSGESMQIIGGPEGITGQGNQVMFNSFQTVTIVPSEVNQESGIVNYVLIVSPDGDKGNEKHIQLDMAGYDIKDESLREVTEEIVQEDGTTHRVLKITPQNFFPGSQTQLMCNICNYTSPKRYLLSRHMKTHSEDRPYKCNICERGFKTLASLTNHVNTHTGTRPHKCKDCESSFTTSGELVRHVRYRHTFEKPHKCPECDYASVELSKLKRHIRMHTGERPYQCQHCSYASPDTYKLKRHLRIHTGEKPYECDQCHARFTQSNSLKAHKLIHSGDKPVFQCDLCPTTCGRKTDLKIHYQKLHTSEHPLQCRKCGQNFPDRYTYKLHLKQHDGEKCFKCDECDYAALSQRHLESHMLVHSGEKPFECSGCDQTFRQKQLLRRHRNIHHTPDYVKPAPKSKSYSCPDCDKTFAHRGNLARHLLELHGKHITFAESEEETDVCELPTISAQHILESNIMQEWRDGKLGNSPQVVIVHPDGRVEEVTPKLQAPPDRSVDDLLEAMSSHTAGSDRLEQENRDIREDMKTKKTEEVKLHSFDDVNPGNKTENKIGDTEVKSGSLKMSPRGVDVESSVTLHQLNVESVGLHKQVKKITAQCQMKEAGTQATIDSDSEDDSFKPVIVSCRTVNANESKSKTVHSNRQKSPAVNNDCFKIKTISSEDVQEDLIQSRSMGLPSSDIGLINSSVTVSDKSMNSESIMPIAPLHDNSSFASYPEVDVVDTGNSSIHTSSQRFIISKTSASPCQSSTTAELQPVLNTTTPHAMHSTISLSPSKNSTEFQGIDTGTISGNVQLETATEDDESGSASTYLNTTKTPVLKVATNSNIVFIKQEANAKNILKSQSPDRLTRSMKRKEIELEASPAKRTRRATTSDSK